MTTLPAIGRSSSLWRVIPALFVCVVAVAAGADAVRLRESCDFDWRFFKGDGPGAEQLAFDDAAWRKLNLPHNWSIEGPFG